MRVVAEGLELEGKRRPDPWGTVIQAGRIRCPTKYTVNRVAVVVGGWRGGGGAQRMAKLFLLAESAVVVGERKILVMIRAPPWCDKPVSVPRPGTKRLCEEARSGNPHRIFFTGLCICRIRDPRHSMQNCPVQ